MTPHALTAVDPSHPGLGSDHAARSPRATDRRRGALLQLARRHGEVRLRVSDGRRAPAGAADMSELLDQLNEDGLLRYGGLRRDAEGCELVYLADR